MKNVAKVIILAIIVAFSSQSSFAQVNFGVKAGLNLANITAKDNDDTYSDDNKMKPGFQVGPVVEFGFGDLISLQTGLMLSTKGYKYDKDGFSRSVNVMYMNIPVNARASFGLGGMKIYGAFGPYIGIALSGKYDWEDNDGTSDSGSLNIGNDTYDEATDTEGDDIKRTDLGLSIGAGAIFGAFEVGLNYDLGLANISPDSDNGYKIKNKVFSITAAFMFGK